MPATTNLVRRGARYYFRSRVPKDLTQHFGRLEFYISLKTTDRKRAEHELVALKARLFGQYSELRGICPPPVSPTENSRLFKATTPIADQASLWSLVEYWKGQSERRPRTLMEVNTVFERFIVCNGDLTPNAVQKHHVIALKDWMLEQGRAIPTIKKAIALLAAVFEAAVTNDRMAFNPAKNVKLPRPKVEFKSRVPFEIGELQRIFASPVFTQNVRPRGGQGEAAFWLPYLGLWTGARLEELGQLLVADVRNDQGIDYIDISDRPGSGKHLKSNSSRRRVPLHQELYRLGFIDYVKRQRKEGQLRLFPVLASAKNRQLTSSWSQWFGRYLRSTVKITDPRKVFHSFRHGFKDACRASGISKDIHDQITGHSSRDVGDGYGAENYPLVPLAEAIGRLNYLGLQRA